MNVENILYIAIEETIARYIKDTGTDITQIALAMGIAVEGTFRNKRCMTTDQFFTVPELAKLVSLTGYQFIPRALAGIAAAADKDASGASIVEHLVDVGISQGNVLRIVKEAQADKLISARELRESTHAIQAQQQELSELQEALEAKHEEHSKRSSGVSIRRV